VMSGAHLPCILRATARQVYVRFHGPDDEHLYAGSYSEDDLRWWADRVGEWAGSGRDVFVYFNNDWEGFAVENAEQLRDALAVAPAYARSSRAPVGAERRRPGRTPSLR